MTLQSLAGGVRRFFDVRPGEIGRIGSMAAILCSLLAANNVIKVVRDALFLSRFPITQLPYVYLLSALVAGAVIAIYSRHTARLSFSRLMLGSLALTVVNVMLFWLLLTFSSAGWILYAYYIWSAIVGMVLVSQFWILANDMFNPREGKRLFGVITAGGTLGALIGGLAANWAVRVLFGSKDLLWLVVAFLGVAFGATCLALRQREAPVTAFGAETVLEVANPVRDGGGIAQTVLGSRHLTTVAALIFVSVIVSTLIDYQFKAAAKGAYPTADALAQFFGSYYAWLGAVTMAAQLWLTGRVLMGLGLIPSLFLLPAALLMGSLGLLLWPGLLVATATRMVESTLRTSANQSGMQILYLPISSAVKKKVKVFVDVVVERVGDAAAAIIIICALVFGANEFARLSYFAIALLALWLLLILSARKGYVDALRQSLICRDISFESVNIDFTDEATLEAVVRSLEGGDEKAMLFALDLAEKMDRRFVAARLPPALLRHESPEVRRRALMFFAHAADPAILQQVLELLASDAPVRSEAINSVCIILKKDSIPIIRPFLESSEPEVQRSAIQCLLRCGDDRSRQEALAAFANLVANPGSDSEKKQLEAARLMGEVIEPEFSQHLLRLISDNTSLAVVREAMVAAARGKYSQLIPELIARLGDNATKAAAREALAEYGATAVAALRNALFDHAVSRDIRLNIPRTLSKIHTQSAMDALMAGLFEEDRTIRFKVILASEEMSRRFGELAIDRQAVETAISSDAQLYCRRFALFFALFAENAPGSARARSLLYHALTDSMERVLERVMWLLALLYGPGDIRRAWAGLQSNDVRQRAHATEFIDNLLTGKIKDEMLPLYYDGQPDQRLRAALHAFAIEPVDADNALRTLLIDEDRWLKTAALWEIGLRKIDHFRNAVAPWTTSEDALLRETADRVMQTLGSVRH